MIRYGIEFDRTATNAVKLRSLDPSSNPESVADALREMMELVIDTSRRTQLSGPRPQELDQVTGELVRSMQIDESGLPFGILGGTDLVWAPVHEYGKKGRLSFLEPALDAAFPQFPEITEKHMLRGFDRA